MNELLAMAIEQHGGRRRWEQVSRFRAIVSIAGDLWKQRGQDGLLDDVVLDGDTRDQNLTIRPFPSAGCYATWEPHRQTIKTDAGVPVAVCRGPARARIRTGPRTPFSELRAVYLAGQASWSYFTVPFLLARDDFTVRDVGSWREDGEVWQRLQVTYPLGMAAHSRRQTYYFDNSGFLCRVDYDLDLLGGEPLADYPSNYCEFDGILIPARHRVYARTGEGTADLSTVVLALDLTDVVFT